MADTTKVQSIKHFEGRVGKNHSGQNTKLKKKCPSKSLPTPNPPTGRLLSSSDGGSHTAHPAHPPHQTYMYGHGESIRLGWHTNHRGFACSTQHRYQNKFTPTHRSLGVPAKGRSLCQNNSHLPLFGCTLTQGVSCKRLGAGYRPSNLLWWWEPVPGTHLPHTLPSLACYVTIFTTWNSISEKSPPRQRVAGVNCCFHTSRLAKSAPAWPSAPKYRCLDPQTQAHLNYFAISIYHCWSSQTSNVPASNTDLRLHC